MAQKKPVAKAAPEAEVLEGKKKMLSEAITKIEKDFGKGSIMKLGDSAKFTVSAVSTGSLTLDMALGINGFPRGRIIEIYGPESSGKTTLALSTIAQVQKLGGDAAFIDAEHALDPVYSKNLGVNIDELLVSQPDCGEQALEITEALVRSGAIDIVVVDSVAALVPRDEIDGNMGEKNMALQARLMSQAMRKLSGAISKTNTIVIFINQLRDSLKVTYGNPEVTTGGKALKFYASVRIDIRRIETLKNGTEAYGNRVKCKVVKNKVAPPFKTGNFDIIFGEGISRESEILDLSLELDYIQKSGSWFSYDGQRIGQGRDNARLFLKQNPSVADTLADKIKASAEKIDMSMKEAMDSEELDAQENGAGLDISAEDF